MFNTVIIGGGAAGLFCGANLEVDTCLILESGKKIGSKILISGGGMCNITNMDSSEIFLKKFGNKKQENFLKPAILNFPTRETINWFEKNGLKLIPREDGKVFPETEKAQSVIDIMQRKIAQKGYIIKYNTKATKVIKNGELFYIKCGEEEFKCKNLVIATGGKSFPETGSDGSGYNLAKDLGHSIITPEPALTSIKIVDYKFKEISGNSVKKSLVDFYHKNEEKRYLQACGDLLFTHQGLSGPVIINNSRFVNSGDTLKFSLIETTNKEETRQTLNSIFNSKEKKTIKRVLKDLNISNSIIDRFSEILDFDKGLFLGNLSKNIKSKIITSLLEFPVTVNSKIGFNGAMVTCGGVGLEEINRKTMESGKIENLYFAGEIIDYDGDTGGYNIQAAFSTAMIAAQSISRK